MSENDRVFVGSLVLTLLICLVWLYFYGWDYPPCEESPNAVLIQVGRDLKVKSLVTGSKTAFYRTLLSSTPPIKHGYRSEGHQARKASNTASQTVARVFGVQRVRSRIMAGTKH